MVRTNSKRASAMNVAAAATTAATAGSLDDRYHRYHCNGNQTNNDNTNRQQAPPRLLPLLPLSLPFFAALASCMAILIIIIRGDGCVVEAFSPTRSSSSTCTSRTTTNPAAAAFASGRAPLHAAAAAAAAAAPGTAICKMQQQRSSYRGRLARSTATTMLASSSSSSPPNNAPDQEEVTSSSGKAKVRFAAAGGGGRGSPGAKEGSTGDTATLTNPLDKALALANSDIGSIAVGIAGFILLLIGRLILFPGNITGMVADSSSSDDALAAAAASAAMMDELGEQTRSDLLAVLACGAVLVNGVSKLDVESASAESVQLQGVSVNRPQLLTVHSKGGKEVKLDPQGVEWACQALLSTVPAKTVFVLRTSSTSTNNNNNAPPSSAAPWEAVAVAGIVPNQVASDLEELKDDDSGGIPSFPIIVNDSNNNNNNNNRMVASSSSPILDRLRTRTDQETYLPTVQNLPGKTEFNTYLPSNTQAVLILPVHYDDTGGSGGEGSSGSTTTTTEATVLVLGSNQARSFTPRDVVWCQAVASRLVAEEKKE